MLHPTVVDVEDVKLVTDSVRLSREVPRKLDRIVRIGDMVALIQYGSLVVGQIVSIDRTECGWKDG